jgi:hypothetical protein
MTSKVSLILTVAVAILLATLTSCKKPAGPGGKASIKGKVYVKDFNISAYGAPISEYYGPGENIYICYGNNTTVGNNVNTSTDGSFEFLYLNKGHYKIFALSRDTSVKVAGSNKTLPVVMEIDITSNTQTFNVPDLVINK